MKFRLTVFVPVFLSGAICALSVFGQNSSTSASSAPNGFSGSAQFAVPAPFLFRMVVTGAPYSAEEVVGQVQTLADGTKITRNQPATKIYRDSFGRTRTERPLFRGMALAGRAPESPLLIEITDTVAQVKYTLDSVNKVAHRQKFTSSPEMAGNLAARRGEFTAVVGSGATVGGGGGAGRAGAMTQVPAFPAPGVAAATFPVPPEATRPQMATEKLGTQTIEGVLAEGTRHTMTWPTGSQGNDRPISVVTEAWTSRDLKVTVLNRTNDPRTGEHTQKLTNISLAEPAASLFQPPAEYSVVDETGAFPIRWAPQ
jgi:hypothetical protein